MTRRQLLLSLLLLACAAAGLAGVWAVSAQPGHEHCTYEPKWVDGQFADMECEHGYSASPLFYASQHVDGYREALQYIAGFDALTLRLARDLHYDMSRRAKAALGWRA